VTKINGRGEQKEAGQKSTDVLQLCNETWVESDPLKSPDT
jgi:hypothetical protein